jgi:putative redox protein
MTSKVIYQGDLRTTMTHLQSGSEVITDAPTDNHGKGEAFSPTDLMATSLASCILTTMAISTMNRNLDINGASAEVKKVMSTEPPRRVARIEMQITMPANNYSDDDKALLEKIAHACPVARSLHPDLQQVVTFVWS